MAAEKLTKGRFAQIIIMLTLLIVVFFWRTFTYQPETVVNCTANTVCNFEVDESVFKAIVADGKIEIQTENKRWNITGDEVALVKPQHWNITYKNTQKLEFINSDSKHNYQIVLNFR